MLTHKRTLRSCHGFFGADAPIPSLWLQLMVARLFFLLSVARALRTEHKRVKSEGPSLVRFSEDY